MKNDRGLARNVFGKEEPVEIDLVFTLDIPVSDPIQDETEKDTGVWHLNFRILLIRVSQKRMLRFLLRNK